MPPSVLPPPRLIEFPRFLDRRGNLSLISTRREVPFAMERAYWIYDVPGGEVRGGHAYRRGEELIVALSGSFELATETAGGRRELFHLNRSYYGVHVPPNTWRELRNFSTNSLALVIASTPYDESDYIRDRDEFDRLAPEMVPSQKASLAAETINGAEITMPRPSVFDCSVLELPRITNRAGNLTSLLSGVDFPFRMNRVFYSYDIPAGESRGGHAHRHCHELVVAASGSFDVVLDDGHSRRTVTLSRPFTALHLPPGIWATEQSFSSGSICLVLASDDYDDSEYVRDYNLFRKLRLHA